MKITYRTNKLKKIASKAATRQKELGTVRAKNFEKRITELKYANCLEDLRHLPQAGIHELTGNRKGQFAANLSGNYRLIFIPQDDPEPRKADGGWDWNAITIVEITETTDYHGN
jgi:proteic killer suppression protein